MQGLGVNNRGGQLPVNTSIAPATPQLVSVPGLEQGLTLSAREVDNAGLTWR